MELVKKEVKASIELRQNGENIEIISFNGNSSKIVLFTFLPNGKILTHKSAGIFHPREQQKVSNGCGVSLETKQMSNGEYAPYGYPVIQKA